MIGTVFWTLLFLFVVKLLNYLGRLMEYQRAYRKYHLYDGTPKAYFNKKKPKFF